MEDRGGGTWRIGGRVGGGSGRGARSSSTAGASSYRLLYNIHTYNNTHIMTAHTIDKYTSSNVYTCTTLSLTLYTHNSIHIIDDEYTRYINVSNTGIVVPYIPHDKT